MYAHITHRAHLLINQGRGQTALLTLLLLLQRSPTLQFLTNLRDMAPTQAMRVVQWAILAVTGSTAVQSLAGATTWATVPAQPTATVGESFQMAVSVTNSPSASKSWKVISGMPEGLSPVNNQIVNTTLPLTITGTPTKAGTYRVTVRAYHNTNAGGDNGSYTFNIVVNPAPVVDLWASAPEPRGGWRLSPWFRWINDKDAPWIWSADHGWLYCVGTNPNSFYAYSADYGWLWITQSIYQYNSQTLRYFWSVENDTWMYYYGPGGSRWMFIYPTPQVTGGIQDFGPPQ